MRNPIPHPPAPAGLLLLTGGQGRRLGAPKHDQPHPAGGSWGGQLVKVFASGFPGAPVCLLGSALPDRPDLIPLDDPRQGPGLALSHWARLQPRGQARRWWVLACDQVRWTPEALLDWHAQALAADPQAERWVLARQEGRIQWLGGWLADELLEPLAKLRAAALAGLGDALPLRVLEAQGPEWQDVDTPEALRAWLRP